ncbi:MAG: UvrD-helicase domain-containing protein, partial [Firmicutes bacterium]|nr:UvrD-helicase domain-containing protein [Bacillota bacterium]
MASFTLDPGPKPTSCVIDENLYDECEKEAKWLIKFLEDHFVGENCLCSEFSKSNTEALGKIKRVLGYDERVAAFRAITQLNEFVPELPKSKQLKELMKMAADDPALQLRLENIGRLANAAAPTLATFAKDKYYKSILFIESFCTYVQEEMEERGLATFDSCLLAAVKMLRIDAKQGGALTSYIQSRYHHFLVDEYQDTSSLQSELFFRLAAEETEDDWHQIKLKPGALFIVGDEKQAIYRFRGGDVDNYQAVREMFEADDNCDVLQLSCNFRSSAPMTEWFNEVFADDSFLGKNFPIIEPSEKQSRFGEQTGTVDGVYKFKVIGTKSGTRNSSKVPGNEEEQVLKLIQDLLDKRIFKYDHKTQKTYTQPITYSDIMIITANKPSLKNYIQLLSQNGIPYSVAGNSRLAGNPVLPMMERLLKAALYPGDKFLKYECLLNPPFSLTEKEVYQFRKEGKGTAAAKAFALLDKVAASIKTDTPSALFAKMIQWLQSWRWLDMTKGDSMDTLYYGLELIRAEEASGKLRNAEELLIFIDEQLRNGGYEYEMAAEERSRGIKLLNLHKSKGLEAPVVILADAKKPSDHEVDLCRDFQSRTVYIGSISKTNEFGKKINEIVGTPQFKVHTDAEAEQLRKEKIRLRYVAATRAENVLLIPEYYKNLGTNGIATAGDREDGRWDDYLKATANDVEEYPFTTAAAAADGTTAQSASSNSVTRPDVQIVAPLEGTFSSDRTYETLNPSKVQLKEASEKKDDIQDCEPVKAALADSAAGDGYSDGENLIRTPESWRAVPATVLGTA